MNVKANQEASKIKKVNSFNVMGSGTDDSLSIGACYSFASKHENNIEPLNHLYLGYEINEKEINHKIKKLNKKKFKIIKKPTNLFFAKLLKRGLILGRCKGKMEFGSRALGARSIIANAKGTDAIKKINDQVKKRDFWMPFAPSILSHRSKDYIINPKNIEAKWMDNEVIFSKSINSQNLEKWYVSVSKDELSFSINNQEVFRGKLSREMSTSYKVSLLVDAKRDFPQETSVYFDNVKIKSGK